MKWMPRFGLASFHFVSIFLFETHFCLIETAEYLVNDDEDDKKQTIGEALKTVKDSRLFDVLRVWFKAAGVNATMRV